MGNDLCFMLKQLREKKKLSQQDVADFLKVKQQAYSNYETGKRQPDLDTLINLADFYMVSLDILTGRYKPNENKTNEIKNSCDKKIV